MAGGSCWMRECRGIMPKWFCNISVAVVAFCGLNGFSYGRIERESALRKFDSCRACVQDNQRMPEDNVYCAYAELEAGMFLKDDSLILLAYMDLGKSFVELEQYGYALQYALYALLLAEEADDRAQAEANWLTGLVYAAIGNDLALGYLDKAYSYYYQHEDTANMIQTLNGKAILFGQQREYQQSIAVFEEMYRLCHLARWKGHQLPIMLNLATAYNLSGRVDEGLAMMGRIDSMAAGSDFLHSYGILYQLNYGELLHQAGLDSRAEEAFLSSLSLAEEAGDISSQLSCLEGLASISLDSKDFSKLSAYYWKMGAVRDSLAVLEKHSTDVEMDVVAETVRTERQLAELQARVRKRWLYGIALACVALSVGWAVFRSFRKRIKAERKNMELLDIELSQKKRELTEMSVYHHEVKKIVNETVRGLQRMETNTMASDDKRSLKKLYRQLEDSFSDNAQRFYDYIDTNYNDFISRLSQRYPSLTVSEKRVSVLLLVGSSTKDIAGMTNLSERTVNNIRSRIRKKLGIADNISIQSFLKTI